MAHLRKDSRSPNWLIQFRWAGNSFSKSCKTASKRRAEAIQGRVEETLRLLNQGQIVMPDDADPGT